MKTGQEVYKEEILIAAGVASALSATFFYRQKKTIPFKLAYFLSWPLLGTAILTAVSPDQEKMRQVSMLGYATVVLNGNH